MSELSDMFPDQHVGLAEVRDILRQEFDEALDDLLLEILHEPLVGTGYRTIVIEVSNALLKHAQELLP